MSAPDAVKLILLPAQRVFVPETAMFGEVYTVRLLIAGDCETHPAGLVPATVKELEMEGLTKKLLPCTE